jgi:hypothetical protein
MGDAKMTEDGNHTVAELDAERRAIGRQHTAQLLKMLRGGYGTTPEPESVAEVDPAAELKSARVADAAPVYVRLVETPIRPDTPTGNAPPRRLSAPPIPTVGESLRQPLEKLSKLIARADDLAASARIFQAYLRPDLRDHVLLIRLDQDAWTVQTESAVWATRLRYALYDIREVLGLHFGITLPKPHIQIAPIAARPPSSPRRTLTQEAARYLEEIARNETDSRLSAALRRLARRAEALSNDHASHPPKQPS